MDKQRVEEVIDERVRPFLESHGGGIDLVDVKEGKVYVHLTGACGGCPMATMTMKQGVERALKASFPDIDEVVNI